MTNPPDQRQAPPSGTHTGPGATRRYLALHCHTTPAPPTSRARRSVSGAALSTPPQDVLDVLELLRAMLQPSPRDQIKSPTDAAGLLMLEMAALDHEELRTVLLDTRNRVQAITTVYVGSLNTSLIRVGEVFKTAVLWNSAALIVVHNHPSGAPRSA